MKTYENFENKLAVVVLGRSGSGKGTQADFIVERLKKDGVKRIITGDLLRKFQHKKNFIAQLAKQTLAEGKLVPSWLIAYLWSRELIEGGYIKDNLIFDGAPRKLLEAKLLDEAMEWSGRSLPLCVYIKVSESEVTKRLLQRGRSDDTPRAIRNRMAYFKKDVLPVINYYQKHNRLVAVDGAQSIEDVWRDIDRALSKRLNKKWPKNKSRG